jgi:hypothetical protein
MKMDLKRGWGGMGRIHLDQDRTSGGLFEHAHEPSGPINFGIILVQPSNCWFLKDSV